MTGEGKDSRDTGTGQALVPVSAIAGLAAEELDAVAAMFDPIIEKLRDWEYRADGAYARETWRAWRGDALKWCRWCIAHGRKAFPGNPQDVAEFLVEAARAGAALTSVVRYASSIGQVHRAAELPDPCRDTHQTVALALRKIRRAKAEARASRPRQAVPLRKEDREALVAALGWTDQQQSVRMLSPTDVRDIALIRTLYDGLFRRSEIVSLRISDLSFERDGTALVLLGRAKNDQEGRGSLRFLRKTTVTWLKRWLRYVNAADLVRARAAAKAAKLPLPDAVDNQDRPIFRRVRAHGHVGPDALAGYSVNLVLQRAGERAQIGKRLSGHSARIGAAQDLDAAGATLLEIMRAADWRSPASPARYVERADAKRGAMARMAEAEEAGQSKLKGR